MRFPKGRVSKLRSKILSGVKSKNTTPERTLHRELRKLGLCCSIHCASLVGRPDFVFRTAKVAVFCDGDFWHGKNWAARRARGEFSVRKEYWIKKIEGNRARDRRVDRELRKSGWTVMRFWESDIKKRAPKIANRIRETVFSATCGDVSEGSVTVGEVA